MFKISACLITKNEEKNIQRCIESFKEAAHETIVVDTGSTDRTVQLAQQLGAKVFHYEWNNNFADAKNYAIEKASGDWIIFLDADEYFYQHSGEKIPDLLKLVHENDKVDALLLHHISIDELTKRAIQSNSLVRIFRNNNNIRYKNSIHESIYKKTGTINLFNVSKNDLVVYHTGYSADRIISKAERNLEMLLKEQRLHSNSNKQRNIIYMYLSDCYVTLSQYNEAIFNARKYIESGDLAYGFNTKAYHNIIRSMRAADFPHKEIIVEIEKAMERFPNHPDFYRYLAVEYLESKQYEQALNYFQRTVELNASYNDVELNTIPGLLTDIYYTIGRIFELKNQPELALDNYFKALTENRYHEGAFHCLIRLIKQQRAEDIIIFLKQIYDITVENDIQFVVRELSALKMGKTLLYFWNIWYKTFGQSDSTFMFALLGSKNYEEALRYFQSCYQEEEAGQWAALFIVVCTLVSYVELERSVLHDIIPGDYQRLASVFYGGGLDLILGQEDVPGYLAILKELVILDEEQILGRLLRIKNAFDIPLSKEIGSLLNDFNRFDLALEQWEESLSEEGNELAHNYFEKAYCEYKLLRYKDAVETFQRAKEQGYSVDEIDQFLCWMKV
ncbi:glycosyltransferase [Paenibacillus sp. TAB 01]|uniref:tetratricopeptide repeat-containing glycosyltransferase family 2 protein n=1 Tax=Paenibacillus sp. TAB 01 TaxID=3368988 RepID=UPI00375392BB